MIPKKIHFCWLSEDPYPSKIQDCINSWKEKLSDYEIIKWDLNRFPLEKCPWVKEAFEAKKYAFAADYIRFYALYTEGGIYLDSDVEVLKSFDDLLDLPYFLGRENVSNNIEAAAMGSQAGLPWLKECLDHYDDNHFIDSQKKMNIKPLPLIMQEELTLKYGIVDISDPLFFDKQETKIQILPFHFFSPKSYMNQKIQISSNTYCIHHFTSSWLSYKDRFLIKMEYFGGKQVRTFFWLLLRNPLHNIRGLLRLFKERKIWWN